MQVNGKAMRTIWVADDGESIEVIDQRHLPHELVIAKLQRVEDAAGAIAEMWVRGAPLIGITAAYGLCLAMKNDSSDSNLQAASEALLATRPTAVNLRWALEQMQEELKSLPESTRPEAAYRKAAALADDDVATCSSIGEHGSTILKSLAEAKGRPLGVLTHCNAGWLATVDWGTALAPIYKAHDQGIDVHVYVDETRPRNQGASLSAWELGQHGVPHTVIVDNAGGHLMQRGAIDVCIVGSDRCTSKGHVCNKIGTYLKALAAHDNNIPFYAALPYSTIDWTIEDGADIPIEERDAREVTHIRGTDAKGNWHSVALCPPTSKALNIGFDVTPARLISGIITERGVGSQSRY
jgi:methylthioribose-1-phosphate isomerase